MRSRFAWLSKGDAEPFFYGLFYDALWLSFLFCTTWVAMMIQISIRELLLSEGAGFVVHFHKRPSELVYNTSYYFHPKKNVILSMHLDKHSFWGSSSNK